MWKKLLPILVLLSCTSTAFAGRMLNGGGNNYAIYDNGSINFGQGSNWYIPAQNLRPVVGLYNLNPTLVANQIAAMRASGQTEIVIPIWNGDLGPCEPSACNDGVPDGVWGEVIDNSWYGLRPQHEQNMRNLLAHVKSNGFKRVIVRFMQNNAGMPTWDETKYQKSWNFLYNTRNLVDSVLAGSNVEALYDLGGELGGLNNGQERAFAKRLWQDYTHVFGITKTMGYSFAWAPGRFAAMKAVYDEVGVGYPPIWGFDLYPSGGAIKTQLQQISNEMGSLNGQPIIILETWHNDASTASNLLSALNDTYTFPNLNVDSLFHWDLNRQRSEAGLDTHFTVSVVDGQISTSQFSNYRGLIGNRRTLISNSHSGYLVLRDRNCTAGTSVPCSIDELWGAAPSGYQHVITTYQPGVGTQLHACVNSKGSQSVNWVVPGQSYTFKIYRRTSCSIPAAHEVPIATSTLEVRN